MKILLVFVLLVTSCSWFCKKCPPIPPPPPPKTVVIRKPCMDLPPALVAPSLPEPPEGAEKIEVPTETLRLLRVFLAGLRSYLEVQLDRCKVP